MSTNQIFIIGCYIFLIIVSCDTNVTLKREYYGNGSLESEIHYKNGFIDGIAKTYYSNGNIKYKGSFKKGIKIGNHLEFYENDRGKIHYEVAFDSILGNEKFLRKRIYNRSGLLTYETYFVNKVLIFKVNQDSINVGDTIILNVKINNPKYQFAYAYIGKLDKKLDAFDPNNVLQYQGENHSVNVPIIGSKIGIDTLKGYISDFKILQITDSTGVTRAEDTYFEFTYHVLNNKQF